MGAHLIDGEFQSDKYPSTPRGKVPLSVKDETAQDLLWEYARRHRPVDTEFSDDLEQALRTAGYKPDLDPSKVHVDEFVEDHKQNAYARWMLHHFRLMAALQIDFAQFLSGAKLFCSYEGTRWRVTGASRFGDIYLTSDFDQDYGYQKRGVFASEVTDWSGNA